MNKARTRNKDRRITASKSEVSDRRNRAARGRSPEKSTTGRESASIAAAIAYQRYRRGELSGLGGALRLRAAHELAALEQIPQSVHHVAVAFEMGHELLGRRAR